MFPKTGHASSPAKCKTVISEHHAAVSHKIADKSHSVNVRRGRSTYRVVTETVDRSGGIAEKCIAPSALSLRERGVQGHILCHERKEVATKLIPSDRLDVTPMPNKTLRMHQKTGTIQAWNSSCSSVRTKINVPNKTSAAKDANLMDANQFLPFMPNLDLVAIGLDTLTEAQSRIKSCEACNPAAKRYFNALLDQVTSRTNQPVDYILMAPAVCTCGAEVTEHTLVDFDSPSPASDAFYFDAPLEQTDIVMIDEEILSEAEHFVEGCECCCSESAEYAFDQILDSLTGCDPTKTDYIMTRPAKCPRCHNEVTEKSLVLPV